MDNKYQWFLGPPTGTLGSITIPAPTNTNMPYFRSVDHLGSGPANYVTAGGYKAPWFSTWSFSQATGYYAPTVADTTPHLLDDIHPWWKQLIFVPSNPIWQACNTLYNPYLYTDPTVGRINPTGSYKGGLGLYQWLDVTFTTGTPAANLIQQFNTIILFRGNPSLNVKLDRYDSWGRGYDSRAATMLVDTFLPTYTGSSMTALRYCLENRLKPAFTSALTDTNLQSYMDIVEGDPQ